MVSLVVTIATFSDRLSSCMVHYIRSKISSLLFCNGYRTQFFHIRAGGWHYGLKILRLTSKV